MARLVAVVAAVVAGAFQGEVLHYGSPSSLESMRQGAAVARGVQLDHPV